MGMFLAASGLTGAGINDIEAVLKSYQSQKQRQFYPAQGTTDDPDILAISGSPGQKVFLLYPGGFLEWEELSQHLSKVLRCPVFSFHIHDGDLWMFSFYVNGTQEDCFNPVPDYWGGISDEELANLKGNASVIAAHWPGVSEKSISRYFTRWDLEAGSQEKAYPDDEFSYGTDWQMCDFIKKLGLTYPLDDTGNLLVSCKTYHFSAD
jgi:hypothetical protein